MQKMQKFAVAVIVPVLSLAVAVLLYLQEEAPRVNEVSAPTMLVDVIRAEMDSAQIEVTAQGSVVPHTQTTIVSEVSGLITEVSPAFVAGGFFRQGDVLVRIDDRNYRAEVKRAQAAVAAAETNATREAGLADYAKEDWQRAKSVLNSSKAATDLALRKPQLAEAHAALEYAKADLEKRLGDLDRTVIRAPYHGLVREKVADLGQFVNASSPLANTFSVDVAEIRLPLPDQELPFLNLDEASLSRGSGPEVLFSAAIGGRTHNWTGRIVRTEGVFDERSRVLYVVAQVDDPYNRQGTRWTYPLRVGTFVEARIEGERLEQVVKLPRSVLRGNDRVWTVTDAHTLSPVAVDIARIDESNVYISSGLSDGQLICTTLLDNPLPGTPVRFQQPVGSTMGASFTNEMIEANQ